MTQRFNAPGKPETFPPMPSHYDRWDMARRSRATGTELERPVTPPHAEPGYHVKQIQRGIYGQISKIIEEAEELKDAAEQGVKLLVHQELADLYGAIDAFEASIKGL